MRTLKLLIVIILTGAATIANAQKTILFGTNPTYKNQKIDVYSCTDYISGVNKLVGSAVADSLGKPLNELRFISIREVREDEV